jgi:hypothetical protein
LTDEELGVAADELVRHLERLGPSIRVVRRLLSAEHPSDQGD